MFSKKTQPPLSSTYAFSSPGIAQSSSDQARKAETETFYKPLPPSSSPGLNNAQQRPTLPPISTATNPFADPSSPSSPSFRTPTQRDYARSPSPHLHASSPSNPLLSPESRSATAATFHDNRANMPSNPSRSYAARPGASGMPPRGESQSALLGDRGASSPVRRYGPSAAGSVAGSAVGQSSSLLSGSSGGKRPDGGAGTDVAAWGGIDAKPEADDYLHNPDPKRDRKNDRGGSIFTTRGVVNIGCLVVLLIGFITLFAGYPIITYYTELQPSTLGGYNLGGINATGQVPLIRNFVSMIDPDTPANAQSRTGFDGQQYSLVWSDEFNKDGRTFYPGDDPYWTAVDLHYWPTGDFEWYDPSAVTTRDGNLVIKMTQEPIHDLNFKSGMLQSWNQMCFQYSVYIEVRVSLPGTPAVGGFWPGVWMMGNLGRPGYGATTEGTWPYTYDSCDLGTLKNQTNAAGTGPAAALQTTEGNALSYLPGQRVSACTCPGEDHPGPSVNKGRGTPEIDIIEAQTDLSLPRGQVSQSAQIAPFDADYYFFNTTNDVIQYDTSLTKWNSYRGGVYQQAVSSLTYVYSSVYQLTSGAFAVYGFEYYANPASRGSGHITWVSQGIKSWSMQASAVGPNPISQVGQRLISEEPMAMVINFGMSNNFQTVNFNDLQWPAEMLVDYVRVYQRPDGKIGCDPADHPTADYIKRHQNAYDNANLTTWAAAGYTFPKNSLLGC